MKKYMYVVDETERDLILRCLDVASEHCGQELDEVTEDGEKVRDILECLKMVIGRGRPFESTNRAECISKGLSMLIPTEISVLNSALYHIADSKPRMSPAAVNALDNISRAVTRLLEIILTC